MIKITEKSLLPGFQMIKIFGAKIRCFLYYYFFESFKSLKLGMS